MTVHHNRMRHTLGWLRRYGAPHRRQLAAGVACTFGVVLLRLAMPWPLRGVLEVAISEAGGARRVLDTLTGGSFGAETDVLVLAASFVVLAVALGYAEMQQRVFFKKYAAHTVHDFRAAAVDAASRSGRRAGDVADLVSRIVGDSARLKAELSGVLVHVSQNALLFAGICTVFLVLAPKLAGLFLAGGLYAIAVGYYGNAKVGTVARKQRQKEGLYASSLVDLHAHSDASRSLSAKSARKDVQTTRLIMKSSWAVHAGLAVLTAVALIVSVRDVRSGAMQPGDLFLYLAYVLTAHRRMVHLGRQLARWGKVEAHTARLSDLMRARHSTPRAALDPLHRALVLRDLRVGHGPKSGARRRLKRTNLTIPAGAKIAIVGNERSSRAVLMQVLAGREVAKGTIEWDGRRVEARELALSPEIRYLPQTPFFGFEPLRKLLGVGEVVDDADGDLVRALGIDRIVASDRKGLDAKVASSKLTRTQARCVVLFELLRDLRASVWILDEPVEGLSRKRADERLSIVRQRAGTRTLVVGLERPPAAGTFDRVLFMRGNRLVEDPRDVAGAESIGAAETT